MKILCINSKPSLSFFTKRGLTLDVTYDICNKIFPPIKVGEFTYSPDVYDYLSTITEKYDAILFGWYPKDYGTEFNRTGGQTFRKKLPNGAYFATVRQDGNNYEAHELMHIIGQILWLDLKKDAIDQMDATVLPDGTTKYYYKNDTPDAVDGNFAITWNSYKKYLTELNNLNKMPTYKYFKDKEIVGLKPELVEKLDKARGIAGFPFVIVSGFRTAEHNAEVGGVENSAHTLGEAVDLSCPDSSKRWKMLNALLQVGFNRLGINKTTIHADISKTLPGNVVWTYYK